MYVASDAARLHWQVWRKFGHVTSEDQKKKKQPCLRNPGNLPPAACRLAALVRNIAAYDQMYA
jgi:hypothetical protein